MKTTSFGYSSLGTPILGFEFGHRGPELLILGGVHGNEPEGVVAAYGLIDHFAQSYTRNLRTTVVPIFNPDGVFSLKRVNSRGIDLNRNLPTQDWKAEAAKPEYNPGPKPNSEPENQALVKWLSNHKPCFIISLHSWHPLLNINGACQPEAECIQKLTGYEIKADIGYPTPGCLGTYCGHERDIPTLTYEIERGLIAPEILHTHVPAILESLKITERRFST